ncbi:MAG: DUF3365 domain-containing protein [Planctomycetota bacterium]|nr:DUF3365 domain-containing protein [Planctomycetota bacterium]
MRRLPPLSLVMLSLAGLLWITLASPRSVSGDKGAKPSKTAVDRSRKTVKMLDDIYKTTVVLVTTHYVNDDDDLPAGTAAKALFAAIKKKGWHEVRLLDVTGEPYSDDNVASDDFDKQAVKQIKFGRPYVEQVVSRDGKSYLRAATSIPVVLKKCTMCHENYKNAKPGEAIGLLSYTIPIE